ncbi:MAG: polysaccharide export protein EpsE [Pseudorhodoferax sp.]
MKNDQVFGLGFMRTWLLFCAFALASICARAQSPVEYMLSPGDTIRVTVYQSPDLTLETRVSEAGTISFPLVGQVRIGGQSTLGAEKTIAQALEKGGFIRNPQVTVVVTQMRGNFVSVLGQVNRPGRYPLENMSTRVSDILATAGGIIQGGGSSIGGDDVVIVTGTRAGAPFRKEIDIPSLYIADRMGEDITLVGDDTVYVRRAPVFYIYGEAQRPGVYRIERGMSVMQALAVGGGPTNRGTENRIRLHRMRADGRVEQLSPAMTDLITPNDVIYVRESLF